MIEKMKRIVTAYVMKSGKLNASQKVAVENYVKSLDELQLQKHLDYIRCYLESAKRPKDVLGDFSEDQFIHEINMEPF